MSSPIAIVVLNWNGWEDTTHCLRSLQKQSFRSFETIVVDNGSEDNSVAHLREEFPNLRLIETGHNLGFAGGCNVGIRAALEGGAAWVLLLNNDAKLDPSALEALAEAGFSDERVGVVGCPIGEEASSGPIIQAWGGGWVNPLVGLAWHSLRPEESHEASTLWHTFPILSVFSSSLDPALGGRRTLLRELAVQCLSLLPGKKPYFTGACLLLRREMLEEVGLLDETFFFTWEDCDLCIRAMDAGWVMTVAEKAFVLHDVSSSSGKKSPLRMRLQTKAQVAFSKKHSPLPVFSSLLYASEETLRLGLRREWKSVSAVFRGFVDGWKEE